MSPQTASDLGDEPTPQASPESSSKISLCTWWQRLQKEHGVKKQVALEKWRAMTAKERRDFGQSIADRIAAATPSPEQKAAKKLSHGQEKRAATLAEFQSKWGYVAKALQKVPAKTYYLQNYEVAFQLYVDIVNLLSEEVFDSAAAAARALPEFHINRKKVSATQTWLDENPGADLSECPGPFAPGRTFPGALSIEQKRDLHKHVIVMQRSNCPFLRHWQCFRVWLGMKLS